MRDCARWREYCLEKGVEPAEILENKADDQLAIETVAPPPLIGSTWMGMTLPPLKGGNVMGK